MPLTEPDFVSIRRLIENILGKRGEYFVTGKVIRRDEVNRLVWLQEFGDQAIPIVAHDYEITYYDTLQSGVVERKKAKVKVCVPKVGETVLVARELGTRRLPRCLGVMQGRNWISPSED